VDKDFHTIHPLKEVDHIPNIPSPEERKAGCLKMIDNLRARVETGEIDEVMLFGQFAGRREDYTKCVYGREVVRREII
jgi:hypothetical protein